MGRRGQVLRLLSIDDNELFNLKKICDEVFGEENHINTVTVKMSELSGVKMKHLMKYPKLKESLLVYAKNADFSHLVVEKHRKSREDLENYLRYYTQVISNPTDECEKWEILSLSDYFTRNKITVSEENINEWKLENADILVYRTNSRTVDKFLEKNPDAPTICKLTNADGNEIIKWENKEMLVLSKYIEQYLGDIWLDISTINLNKENEGVIFDDGQKPLSLIRRIIKSNIKKDICVLDFFSGSATSAHAVILQNAEDNGNRRFIMVQLPEPISTESEAYRAGYPNICEIGIERINRAGNSIRKNTVEAWNVADFEQRQQLKNPDELDIGYKVFKLDSTNLIKWNPDRENLEASLLGYVDNLEPGRSEEDLLYEVMLKMGADLTWPIETHKVGIQTIYSVGFGALMVCLSDRITTEVADAMARLKAQLKPETWKVVFKDSGFADDMAKTNIKETLKCAGLPEDAFTTL